MHWVGTLGWCTGHTGLVRCVDALGWCAGHTGLVCWVDALGWIIGLVLWVDALGVGEMSVLGRKLKNIFYLI